MSRVRDALRRANALIPSPVIETAPPEASKTAVAWEEVIEELASPEVPAAAGAKSKPRFIPLLRHRWARKLLRLAGMHPPHVPLQKCQGMTRHGQPCRGPAMANGYCRLHGGSRQISVVEKTRQALDRVLAAR